jgi:hypothetical protein
LAILGASWARRCLRARLIDPCSPKTHAPPIANSHIHEVQGILFRDC